MQFILAFLKYFWSSLSSCHMVPLPSSSSSTGLSINGHLQKPANISPGGPHGDVQGGRPLGRPVPFVHNAKSGSGSYLTVIISRLAKRVPQTYNITFITCATDMLQACILLTQNNGSTNIFAWMLLDLPLHFSTATEAPSCLLNRRDNLLHFLFAFLVKVIRNVSCCCAR